MDVLRAVRDRLRSLPQLAMDSLIALGVLAVELYILVSVDGERIADSFGFVAAPLQVSALVVVLGAAPLPWRRRAPQLVLALTFGVSLAGVSLQAVTSDLAAALAFYTAAAYVPRPRSYVVCAVATGAVAVVLVVTGRPDWIVSNLILLLATWALGDRQQTRNLHTSALEARAERAEAERDRNARLAVSEERARIARELHDVLAHSVSVMVVQAAAARRTLRADPTVAEEALVAVEETGRHSLGDLRGLLGLLRDEAADPELAPLPGMARLSELIDGFVDAGLPVRVEVSGTARPLTSRVDLSAYRIVQEALTNALKHAHPREVVVRIRYGDASVEVEVVDDGAGRSDPLEGAGHGLAGMRERAALVGGTLRVGPRAGGGFRVAASLPAPTP